MKWNFLIKTEKLHPIFFIIFEKLVARDNVRALNNNYLHIFFLFFGWLPCLVYLV